MQIIACHVRFFWGRWFIIIIMLKEVSDTLRLIASRVKAMAPHSSTLAWQIPWTEEPGRLKSMGSLEVGHD